MIAAVWLITLMASTGPTTLTFSSGETSFWQRVTANGQLLEAVAQTPLEKPAGCYGMGRLFDRTLWVATEQHVWTLSPDLTQRSMGVSVETIAGSSGRHLYRIVRGQKLKLPRPQLDHATVLEEIDPKTWAVTRAWTLPGHYSQYGKGHLVVDWAESVAYYAMESSSGVVHRHDLLADAALPDLIARTVVSGGLLCFHNGSIVVGYIDGPIEFAPEGTHQRTYPCGPLRAGQGLLAHGADQRTFWVQGFEDGTPYSTLYEFDRNGDVRHQWNTPANGVQWDAPFVDDQRWRY